MSAIGMIETKGQTGLVEATDAMLKAANVEYVKSVAIGGAFITVGVGVCRTPDGTQNAGVYRMQYHGPRTLGLAASPYTDFDAIRVAAEREGKPLEFAVAIGVDPAIHLATQARVPFGTDEFAIAGGLRGAPVELVRCRTVDIEVPATSEIVIEGVFRPGIRQAEGPFGEFTYIADEGGVTAPQDGDVIKATVIGDVITLYLNDVPLAQATDSTFADGNPGMGFYKDQYGGDPSEFGFDPQGRIVVIDEVHTPDSSRLWQLASYEQRLAAGQEPEALDKEYVRRYLVDQGYRGDGPPPPLPDEVRVEAARRYIAAYERVTGQTFAPDVQDPLPRLRRNLGIDA